MVAQDLRKDPPNDPQHVGSDASEDKLDVDHPVVEGVTPEPTPGPRSVVIRSGGRGALITGDVARHPLRVCRPEVCSRMDWDEAMAIETRRRIFGRYAGTRALLLGTHVADPTGVLVVEHGDAWRVDSA